MVNARLAALILCSGTLGAGTVSLFFAGGSNRNESAPTSGMQPTFEVRRALRPGALDDHATVASARVVDLAGRIERYRAIAESNSVERLGALIESTLSAQRSLGRDIELEALIGRLFEIDPQAALDLAISLDIPYSLLQDIFVAWAYIDRSAAVALLDRMPTPQDEMLLALAILDVADYDDRLTEDLVAEGRTLDLAGLAMEAAVQRARRDPFGAVLDAQRLGGFDTQVIALQEIARTATSADPRSALAVSELVGDWYQRDRFKVELYREWAGKDAPGFLSHLATESDPWAANRATGALRIAAAADPWLVIEFADETDSREVGDTARSLAIEAIAEEDPVRALTYVETLPAEQVNDAVLAAVAAGYARADLTAASAWATSLRPRSDPAIYAVLKELASIDLPRAIDFELANALAAPPAWLIVPINSDLGDPVHIANQIVAADRGERARVLLHSVVARWVETDPHGALTWIQSQGSDQTELIHFLAERLGARDLRQALDLAQLVPSEARAGWLVQALVSSASYDPERALSALEQFRDAPFYGSAMSQMISSASGRFGPRVGAELLKDAPSSALRAALPIARRWAETDASAAAAWAATLSDPEVRLSSIQTALQVWVNEDVVEASSWARGLQDRTLRDEALSYICRRAPEAPHCA